MGIIIKTKHIELEIEKILYDAEYNEFEISFVDVYTKGDIDCNLNKFWLSPAETSKLLNFSKNTDDEELYKLLNVEKCEYGF